MYRDDLYQHLDARVRTISGIHERCVEKNIECCYSQKYWVLNYLIEGEVRCRTAAPGQPWRMRKKGEAHLYSPNTKYWERFEKGVNVKTCYIMFECNDFAALNNLIPSPSHYTLFYDDSSTLLKLFQKFETVLLLSEEKQFLMAQSIFWEIILQLSSCQPSESGEYHLTTENILKQKSQLIQDMLEWINKNLTKKITLQELTKRFAISRTALYQRFLAETGETPFITTNRLRLKHADDLIQQGCRLKKAAEETGFSSEYHLSKAYKKQFGISPGKLRGNA